MNTILHTLDNISNSIQDAWEDLTTEPATPPLSKAAVTFLEEQERANRIGSPAQTMVTIENARQTAALISNQSFPYFRGNMSAGYKRITNQLEEHERNRRISAKSEATIHRMNANKIASLVTSLGWPFYNHSSFQGPEFIAVDQTYFLEEEERSYRMNNPVWALSAKNNAALMSNLMRWEWDNAKYYSLGMKRWSRGVEEKERTNRLADKVGMETAIVNAYNVSGVIRNLGWPFFVQAQEMSVDVTWELEEKERKWRVSHPEEQQLAREIAGRMFEGVESSEHKEEKERSRRMENFDEQYSAIAHAKQVSALVCKDTERLIEEERQFRLASADTERKNAKRVAHMISGLGMTVSGIVYLEEKERKRRIRDIEWQTVAQKNARDISSLLGTNFGFKLLNTLEETERNDRMWNKSQQLVAIKNARTISRMLRLGNNNKLATRGLEDKERIRRMTDNKGQIVAMNNAKFVAGLISANNKPFDSLALEEEERTRRMMDHQARLAAVNGAAFVSRLIASNAEPKHIDLSAVEEQERALRLSDNSSQQMAKFNASKVSALISSRLPAENNTISARNPLPTIPVEASLPRVAPADFVSGDLFNADAPIAQPMTPAPAAATLSAPITQVVPSFSSAPLVAPVAPVAPLAAPLAAPITTPITQVVPSFSSAPLVAPVAPVAPAISSAPRSAPVLLSPTEVATIPTHSFVSYGTPRTSSVLPASGLQLHSLTDADRKRLEKQAVKHNKKAAKESKRASNNLAKAAKLHNKGKDSRALKAETRAEQHSVAAKHHQLWANDLTKDAYANPTNPLALNPLGAPISNVGRPAM